MNALNVRLSQVDIRNFKNVENGWVSFENRRRNYRASILGLYGQNGSGKTSLIDVIQLLQILLRGQSIPYFFADCVSVGAECAHIRYLFNLEGTGKKYQMAYDVSLRKVVDQTAANVAVGSDSDGVLTRYRAEVFDEILSCSYMGVGKRERLSPIINTAVSARNVFAPKSKYDLLVGKTKSMDTDLIVARKMASSASRSFVFSIELLDVMRQNGQVSDDVDFSVYYQLIDRLVMYGNYELFVINTSNLGIISMNAQPLAFKYEDRGQSAVGLMLLPLEHPVILPSTAVDVMDKVIRDMNIVLNQLVPGLTIGMRKFGNQLLPDNQVGIDLQLVSMKNSKEIPLKYESDGIKKIISILQLLIVVYNKQSITVAIDELDSGIFEYLLGEILRILSEKGKGQLIFTSHNLRPLETIDKGFIAFTTTNPSNRYIRLNNVKETNNLRDFYFRDIVLGGQSESVYNITNNAEIALAFREAGEIHAL